MEKIDEVLNLTRENNKILRGMRRSQRLSSLFQMVYWLIILGIAFGAYYYIQPMIEPFLQIIDKTMSDLQGVKDSLGGMGDNINISTDKIGELLNI